MQTPKIDKSAWGDGPWMTEPDRVDFIHSGFACLALRHLELGHWCGYVGVPSEHPAYGKPYGDVEVEFHGGLTYAAPCEGEICHDPQPGMPVDVWWLGGDFAHAWDLAPGMATHLRSSGISRSLLHDWSLLRDEMETYRDLPYVRQAVERLAEQLAAMTPSPIGGD